MAMEIFRLVGSIFVDNEEANKSISKTDEKAQGASKSLADGLKTAGKWAAGVTAGAAAAVTGIAAFAKKTASSADTVDKMSQKLNISRSAYQELDFVLSQSGTSVDSMSGGMKTLLASMDKVTEGNKSATTNFEKLGVSVTDVNGNLRSQEEVFYDAVSAFQQMEDSSEKTRLAQELFGKSGSELMPLLNSEAGSFEAMAQEAHDLGLVLDDDLIDSGVSLTDTLDKLQRAGGAIFTRLGGAIMPLVEKFANFIIDHLPEIESLFAELEPVMSQVFDQILPPLMDLAQELLPIIVGLIRDAAPMLAEIVAEVLPIISEILAKILPFFVELVQKILPVLFDIIQAFLPIIEELLPLLEPILDLIMALIEPLLELIDFILPPILKLIQKVASVITSILKPIIVWLKDFLGDGLKNAVAEFKAGIMDIPSAFSAAWSSVKDAWSAVVGWFENVGNGIKGVFENLGSGIKNAFKVPLNYVISGINTFIRGLNKIKIPEWVPAVGGKGFAIKELPTLAAGGVLEKGQTGLLEGNGAEAVVPLQDNKKWISNVAKDMDAALGGSSADKVLAILAEILSLLEQILGAGIYLDTGALVGGIAGPMDRKLGQIAVRKARA